MRSISNIVDRYLTRTTSSRPDEGILAKNLSFMTPASKTTMLSLVSCSLARWAKD